MAGSPVIGAAFEEHDVDVPMFNDDEETNEGMLFMDTDDQLDMFAPTDLREERRNALRRGEWSPLELRRDAGGLRHYLDGESVHCGSELELQTLEYEYDGDGHEYPVPRPWGSRVRYEATLWHGAEAHIAATLYADVGGRPFRSDLAATMRFRWPRR